MKFKQPRSVQVVVFAQSNNSYEFLLLKRVSDHGGFWQSVTGSLEEGETHLKAAVREVEEETGITCRAEEFIDLAVVNNFALAPQWLPRYAPGTTHNEEVCFALKVDKCEVRIDPREHEDYIWVEYPAAMDMLFWDSSKRAFAALKRLLS